MKSFIPPPQIFSKLYLGLLTISCFSFLLPTSGFAQDLCGITTFNLTMNTGDKLSDYFTGTAQMTNWNVQINGIVEFDLDATIKLCSLRLGTNAVILVGPNRKLDIRQSIVSGCNFTWGRIEIQAGATLIAYSNVFRGGEIALDFRPDFNDGNTQIVNCRFYNNGTGIRVGKKSIPNQVPVEFIPKFFFGNIFSQDAGTFEQNGNGIGMDFYNCSIGLIGYTYPLPNQFNGLIGIRVVASSNVLSDIKIKGQTFIYKNDYFYNDLGLDAIQASRNSLAVQNCTFNNFERCIVHERGKGLTAKGNNFSGFYDTGIFTALSSWFQNFGEISDNNFTLDGSSESYAIDYERCFSGLADQSYNEISDNVITVTGENHSNLSLIHINSPLTGEDIFPIADNKIEVQVNDPIIHGIYVTDNSSQLDINGNTLDYNAIHSPNDNNADFTNNLAIAVVGVAGFNNRIFDNHVTSALFVNEENEEAGSNVKCPFHIEDSPDFVICSNSSDDTYRGAHFSGDLNQCDFAQNTIGKAYYGIECRLNMGSGFTNMMDQNWHENCWEEAYLENGARYYDSSIPPFRFSVDPTPPNGKACHFPSDIDPSNWFIIEEKGTSSSSCVAQPLQLSAIEEMVIKDSMMYESAVDEWDWERRVMLKLYRYPDLLQPNSDAENFFADHQNSSSGTFAETEHKLHNVWLEMDSLEAVYRTQQTALASITDSLVHLVEAAGLDSIGPDSVAMVTLLQQRSTQYAVLLGMDTMLLHDMTQMFEDLNGEIELLADDSIYEYNLKHILRLKVLRLKGDTLANSDLDLLRSIANQCPSTAGVSVRRAAWLLPSDERLAYSVEDYWAECDSAQLKTSDLSNDLDNRVISIRPNPASSYILFELPNNIFSGSWSITGLLGQNYIQGEILEHQKAIIIDLSAVVSNGIYFFQYQGDNGYRNSVAFVILR